MVWRDEDPSVDGGRLRENALEDVREVYPHPTRDPERYERRSPRVRHSNRAYSSPDDDPRTPEGISDGWGGKPWRAWGGHTPGRHSDRSSEWGTPGVRRYHLDLDLDVDVDLGIALERASLSTPREHASSPSFDQRDADEERARDFAAVSAAFDARDEASRRAREEIMDVLEEIHSRSASKIRALRNALDAREGQLAESVGALREVQRRLAGTLAAVSGDADEFGGYVEWRAGGAEERRRGDVPSEAIERADAPPETTAVERARQMVAEKNTAETTTKTETGMTGMTGMTGTGIMGTGMTTPAATIAAPSVPVAAISIPTAERMRVARLEGESDAVRAETANDGRARAAREVAESERRRRAELESQAARAAIEADAAEARRAKEEAEAARRLAERAAAEAERARAEADEARARAEADVSRAAAELRAAAAAASAAAAAATTTTTTRPPPALSRTREVRGRVPPPRKPQPPQPPTRSVASHTPASSAPADSSSSPPPLQPPPPPPPPPSASSTGPALALASAASPPSPPKSKIIRRLSAVNVEDALPMDSPPAKTEAVSAADGLGLTRTRDWSTAKAKAAPKMSAVSASSGVRVAAASTSRSETAVPTLTRTRPTTAARSPAGTIGTATPELTRTRSFAARSPLRATPSPPPRVVPSPGSPSASLSTPPLTRTRVWSPVRILDRASSPRAFAAPSPGSRRTNPAETRSLLERMTRTRR